VLASKQCGVMRWRRTLVALVAALGTAVPVFAAASGDPLFSEQYGPQQIRAPEAWARSVGAGITIAVVDSGVDASHPDLAGQVEAGLDLVDRRGDGTTDDCGHGTHVAGIAAAATGNGVGIAGVAPGARILPVRVFSKNPLTGDCEGYLDDVVAGIDWALDHGARVVNLSLGPELPILGAGSIAALEQAAERAFSRGALAVIAAGNSLLLGSTQPSGYRADLRALVVTATDRSGDHPSYANRADTAWSLAAPGDDILSTVPGARYATMSGTSMATPHAAGVAAMLFAEGLDNRQVVERMLTTARPLGSRAVNGAGLLDAAAAVALPGTGGSPRVATAAAPTTAVRTRTAPERAMAPTSPPAPPPTSPTSATTVPVGRSPGEPPSVAAGPTASSESAARRAPASRAGAREELVALAAALAVSSAVGAVLARRRMQ
jgi:serine protease